MTIAITGGYGFVGWHTAVLLRTMKVEDTVLIGRDVFADRHDLAKAIDGVDTVIHLAGVNRAGSDSEVEEGNVRIAEQLSDALAAAAQPTHVVYGNSVQSRQDNAYGRGKARAGEILQGMAQRTGGSLADAILPNLFGEHGAPHYNSFVATFCHEIAHGVSPVIEVDKTVSLLHVQDAAANLVSAARRRGNHVGAPAGEEHQVSDVLDRLRQFDSQYRAGQIPALLDKFSVDLFNTYRSFMFPQHFPFGAEVHADQRGELFETVRFHGGTGQTFASTTVPGAVRGDHYHLSKIERFFVLSGTAEISLRRVLHEDVVRFRVTGSDHAFVDMPTLWVHNIKNVGDEELVTMFWADQLLNPAAPDTYWESVDSGEPRQ